MYIMLVNKIIDWNSEKNEILKEKRNVCFEDVEVRIQKGDILKITYVVYYKAGDGPGHVNIKLPSGKVIKGYIYAIAC